MTTLKSRLSKILPLGKKFEIIHLQSNPRETHPIITQNPSTHLDLKTIKVEHFITLAQDEVIFFGLEIFKYITINYEGDTTEVLLFVSKADTNGYNESKVRMGAITQEILDYLLKIPIEYYLKEIIPKQNKLLNDGNSITKFTSTKDSLQILINRQREKKTVPNKIKAYKILNYPQNIVYKISLFTRAEGQYLFPNSSENSKKHILSGEGLSQWWLGLLDNILLINFDPSKTTAKVKIPSEENRVLKRYIEPLKFSKWSIGDIFNNGTNDQDIAVFKIPLFPDDPKARFLEHLVVENRIKRVSLKQFWQELQIRQEFRLGATVSIVGIEGYLKPYLKDDISIVEEIIKTPYRNFKQLKSYIVGEDYTDIEGAIEAYKNIKTYLKENLKKDLDSTIGEFVLTKSKKIEVNTLTVNNLSTLVRKKQKNK
ncbi:hypothetical protein WICMUC_001040 [Wickerhamomyces mucosus]|uniref:histone acetyltransferase n=1 Tax=Wickerhamomyces mucosus TaxID=1378264 RepID=A0A9P8PY02_9ASCO|nr:hypothetical protein WICMUC_001040 [Wickerhamomyces mucosus]